MVLPAGELLLHDGQAGAPLGDVLLAPLPEVVALGPGAGVEADLHRRPVPAGAGCAGPPARRAGPRRGRRAPRPRPRPLARRASQRRRTPGRLSERSIERRPSGACPRPRVGLLSACSGPAPAGRPGVVTRRPTVAPPPGGVDNQAGNEPPAPCPPPARVLRSPRRAQRPGERRRREGGLWPMAGEATVTRIEIETFAWQAKGMATVRVKGGQLKTAYDPGRRGHPERDGDQADDRRGGGRRVRPRGRRGPGGGGRRPAAPGAGRPRARAAVPRAEEPARLRLPRRGPLGPRRQAGRAAHLQAAGRLPPAPPRLRQHHRRRRQRPALRSGVVRRLRRAVPRARLPRLQDPPLPLGGGADARRDGARRRRPGGQHDGPDAGFLLPLPHLRRRGAGGAGLRRGALLLVRGPLRRRGGHPVQPRQAARAGPGPPC